MIVDYLPIRTFSTSADVDVQVERVMGIWMGDRFDAGVWVETNRSAVIQFCDFSLYLKILV